MIDSKSPWKTLGSPEASNYLLIKVKDVEWAQEADFKNILHELTVNNSNIFSLRIDGEYRANYKNLGFIFEALQSSSVVNLMLHYLGEELLPEHAVILNKWLVTKNPQQLVFEGCTTSEKFLDIVFEFEDVDISLQVLGFRETKLHISKNLERFLVNERCEIQYLDMWACRISEDNDGILRQIVQSSRNLRTIDLSQTALKNSQWSNIFSTDEKTKLPGLTLKVQSVSKRVLENIARILPNSRITSLDIEETKWHFKDFPELKKLWKDSLEQHPRLVSLKGYDGFQDIVSRNVVMEEMGPALTTLSKSLTETECWPDTPFINIIFVSRHNTSGFLKEFWNPNEIDPNNFLYRFRIRKKHKGLELQRELEEKKLIDVLVHDCLNVLDESVTKQNESLVTETELAEVICKSGLDNVELLHKELFRYPASINIHILTTPNIDSVLLSNFSISLSGLFVLSSTITSVEHNFDSELQFLKARLIQIKRNARNQRHKIIFAVDLESGLSTNPNFEVLQKFYELLCAHAKQNDLDLELYPSKRNIFGFNISSKSEGLSELARHINRIQKDDWELAWKLNSLERFFFGSAVKDYGFLFPLSLLESKAKEFKITDIKELLNTATSCGILKILYPFNGNALILFEPFEVLSILYKILQSFSDNMPIGGYILNETALVNKLQSSILNSTQWLELLEVEYIISKPFKLSSGSYKSAVRYTPLLNSNIESIFELPRYDDNIFLKQVSVHKVTEIFEKLTVFLVNKMAKSGTLRIFLSKLCFTIKSSSSEGYCVNQEFEHISIANLGKENTSQQFTDIEKFINYLESTIK